MANHLLAGSTVECAQAIARSEGISALYTGFGATCARNCTFNGVYFMMIKATHEGLGLDHNPAVDFMVGAWASFAATIVKLPADIAKSRIQNQLPPTAEETANGVQKKYRNVLQVKYSCSRYRTANICSTHNYSAMYVALSVFDYGGPGGRGNGIVQGSYVLIYM
jgi:hypothetical protein